MKSNIHLSQAKKMTLLKAKDKGAADVPSESGDVLSKFRDYDGKAWLHTSQLQRGGPFVLKKSRTFEFHSTIFE